MNKRKCLAFLSAAALLVSLTAALPVSGEPVGITADSFTQYIREGDPMSIVDGALHTDGKWDKLAAYNGQVADDFSLQADITTNAGGVHDALIFRCSAPADFEKGAGIDGTTGYAVFVETRDADKSLLDIFVCKYVGAWKGFLIPEGYSADFHRDGNLLNGKGKDYTITLRMELQGNMLKIQAYLPENPSIATAIVTYDLSKPATAENAENNTDIPAGGSVGLLTMNYAAGKRFSRVDIADEPSGSASLFSGTYYREIAESGDINVVDGAYYADGAGYKRLLFDDDVPDDFRVQADMTLGEQGKIRSGFIIRSHVNGAGVDNFSGYQCLLEKGYDEANPNRIDLILYKNGTRNTDDDYAWLGQVARAINEGSGGWLAGLPNNGEGAKIRLVVEVKGSELSMYAYCLDDPAMKTQVLRADLKTPGDFDDKKQEYFDSGAVALTTSWYPAAIENVQIAPLSEAGEAGPLDTLESYDLYTTFGGTFLEKDGWFVAAQPGTKRAIVKNLEITDFSASMTAALDGNGNINVAFPLRVQYAGNGQDDLVGYTCGLERVYTADNEARLDIVVHKFSRNAEGKMVWLGQVARFVDEGGGAVLAGLGKAAGQELVFTVDVLDDRIRAFAYRRDDPTRISGTLSASLKTAPEGDTEKLYYEKGGIGISAADIGETRIDNKITGVRVAELKAASNGTFSKTEDFYYYTEDGRNLYEKDGLFTADGKGLKKALVRHASLSDQTVSVELYKNAEGDLKGGLLLRASEVSQWGGTMKGYAIYVESFKENPKRIDIAVYKYGKLADGNLNWLGYMKAKELEGDRFVSEGDGSIADGAKNGFLLTASLKGGTMTVTLRQKGTDVVSQTLTYDLSEPTLGTLDAAKETYEKGATGVILEKGAFANLKITGGVDPDNPKPVNPGTGVFFPVAAVLLAATGGGLLAAVRPGKRKKQA